MLIRHKLVDGDGLGGFDLPGSLGLDQPVQ